MKGNQPLRYERKLPIGTLEKRLAIVAGQHQGLKKYVMAEIGIRIPDSRLVVRYSVKDAKGRMGFCVAESDANVLTQIAKDRVGSLISSWSETSTITFSLAHKTARYSVKAFGEPISRSLGKNNAIIDIDRVGSFAYVDIDNVAVLPVLVAAAVVIVVTCILASAITNEYECSVRVTVDGKTVEFGFTKTGEGPAK